jgi:predicted acetyltransferase
MNVEVIPAGIDAQSVVLNLALYYIHDFTDFLGFRCPDSGLFRTSHWGIFWSEANRWAFLVKVDGELAGLVLVGPDGAQPTSQYDVAEFFILRKFRRKGVGEQAARDVFNRFRGRWEVRVIVENEPALAFWRRVLSRYTSGRYVELPEPITCGQWQDRVLTFDNGAG